MFSLLKAAESLEERLATAFGTVGLSLPKFSVLAELVRAGEPLPLATIASRLSCVRSNVTQLIDRLEKDGMVKRIDDPNDRRSVRAALTPFGRDRQAAGAEQLDQITKEFAERLSEDDRAAIERLAAKIG
jgi:DNA-binding MarR family transcriptional regulator